MHRTENSLNLQGYLYDNDALGSSTSYVNVCDLTLNWTATIGAAEGNPADRWGAEFGLRICEASASDPSPGAVYDKSSCPLDGDQNAITGVSFQFCGSSGGYPDRMYVAFPENEGPGAYKIIDDPAPGQSYTVYMTNSDVRVWWDAGQYANPSQVTAIAWNVPSLDEDDQSVNICVTNVQLLGSL